MWFVLYIVVLRVSVRFSVRFGIYEHIQSYVFATLFESIFFRNDEDATPVFVYFLIAPTASGPISSCRASETHGN